MKKILIILSAILCFTNIVSSQTYSFEMYKNIKEYYDLVGVKIEATSKKEIEENIKIEELVNGLNSNQISMYDFCSVGNDTPFDIIIIENDSIEIWDITAINSLLRRVIDISKKYTDISDNRKVIKWIDEILNLHLQVLHKSPFSPSVMAYKRGKYTYNIMLESLKKTKP
jgi:hypothetical protein